MNCFLSFDDVNALAARSVVSSIVLYSLAASIKHYKYTGTSTKNKREAGTPKNPKIILSKCPKC